MNESVFKRQMESRAKRLVKLLDVSAPDAIIGNEVILILKAAMGYCPSAVGAGLASWLGESARNEGVINEPEESG